MAGRGMRVFAVLLVAAGLLLLARAAREATAAPSAGALVTILDFEYRPTTVRIRAGDSVTWYNQGPTPHTATANNGAWDTGMLMAGQSGTIRFTTPGQYGYYCLPHPFMVGTVIVEAGSPNELPETGDAPASGLPLPILLGAASVLILGGSLVLVRAR